MLVLASAGGDASCGAAEFVFWGGSGIMRVSGSGGEPVAINVANAFYPQMLPRGPFFYTSGTSGQEAAVFGALWRSDSVS